MADLKAMTTRLLTLHEGVRLKPYRDTVGKLTIGIGRNLDDRGITREEAEYLLSNDISDVWLRLVSLLPFFARLDTVRQSILLDMAFNLGVPGLMAFKNTLAAIGDGRYADAAAGMLASRWAEQVGRRAQRLSEMMRTGNWPDELRAEEK
jgi:lysozyme